MLRRFLWTLLVIVLAGGAAVWWMNARVRSPYRGFPGDDVFVELPPGTGVSGIAGRLSDAGVVPDALTLRIAARLQHAERRLQAGEYRFSEAASPLEVVSRLVRGDVYVRAVTFTEGHTIAEMAATFEHSGLGTSTEFQDAARDASLIADLDPDASSLEGFLFPDTYALPRQAGAAQTVAAMVARFRHAFDDRLRADAAAQQLSPREAVTLASIVEKETGAPEERPLVAAVYRNRLRIGMPLQCDPTVIYALMRAGRWHGNLRREDLSMDSPYNTYKYSGLPPGPIASPGRASLDAAVHPADVPYLYFVSRNDGTHVFAATLAEHNHNVAKWQVQYFKNHAH